MKIRNAIFDLDGTLLDTTEGVLESVKYAVGRLGYPELSDQTLLKFIGPPIQQSFMTYYGATKEQAQNAAEIFREYYKTEALLKAVPYAGIYELCEGLKREGLRLAVATYKREDYARTLLRHYRFDEYCNPMYGADNRNQRKKADIVELCMGEMGAAKEDTVLIGDTKGDASAADALGISFIAVTYGFGFRDSDDASEYANIGVAGNPLEIKDIIFNV